MMTNNRFRFIRAFAVAAIAALAIRYSACAETPPANPGDGTRTPPSAKEDWEIKTEELLKKNRVLDAVRLLNDETAAHPANAKIWHELIRILDESNQKDEAFEIATRAAESCKNDFKCQLQGGYAYRARGDAIHAEECFKRAIGLDPKSADPRRLLIKLYTESQRNAEAVAEVEKALALFPEDYELLKASAAAYYGGMNFAAGEKTREKVAEIRKKLLDSGRKDLQFDEYVFHAFPIDEHGGMAKACDGFSASDKPGAPAALFTFRISDKDGKPRRALALSRRIQDGKTSYVLEEFRLPAGTQADLKSFGDAPPAYVACLNFVMDYIRKNPLEEPPPKGSHERRPVRQRRQTALGTGRAAGRPDAPRNAR
jgi:tetratricopeptide (TPR) repeat protein